MIKIPAAGSLQSAVPREHLQLRRCLRWPAALNRHALTARDLRSLEVIPINSRSFLPLFLALIVALLLPAPARSAATPDVPFLGDVYELQAPTQQVLETVHKRVADKAVIQSLDDDYNDLRASVN